MNKYEEYIVDSVEKSKGGRISVTIMRVDKKEVYVCIANQYKSKTNNWFDKRKVYIPIKSRAAVETILSIAGDIYDELERSEWVTQDEE